jgi:hypothetical protein
MTYGAMTEKQLLEAVRSLCRMYGLLVYHTHRSDRSEPGSPDLVIVGASGVLFRELKSATGRPTTEQTMWLNALRGAGADAGLWRPSDLASGAIPRALSSLRRVAGTEAAS